MAKPKLSEQRKKVAEMQKKLEEAEKALQISIGKEVLRKKKDIEQVSEFKEWFNAILDNYVKLQTENKQLREANKQLKSKLSSAPQAQGFQQSHSSGNVSPKAEGFNQRG